MYTVRQAASFSAGRSIIARSSMFFWVTFLGVMQHVPCKFKTLT